MNNDLISRDELLKRIDEEREYLKSRGQFGAEHILVHNFRDLVENAPAVDFEKLGESLNCQIRAHYGSCDGCLLSCPRNELIKLLGLARPQDEWIPVSERLPKDRNLVLVTAYWHETYQVMQASYFGEGEKNGWWCVPWNNCGEHMRNDLHVIAWHELPKPYKEDSTE